ncbi:MAG: hypothetical protein EXS59_02170 [Candidatus Taylorbacteria bacterium]|nr:hypothetical protein [Candidatus Taylorbacteria bacterium]
MNKFFLVGETDPRCTGIRFFAEVASEEEARKQFYERHPDMRRRPAWMVKVKEISEMEFLEQRV